MGDNLEPLFTVKSTCSLCGSEGQSETRFSAVIAQTYYKDKWDGKHVARGDLAIWKLHICPICMSKARLSFLDRSIDSDRKAALLGLFLLLVGIAGFVWFDKIFGEIQQPKDIVEALISTHTSGWAMMFSLLLAFSTIAGAIFAPVSAIKAFLTWRSRCRMTESDLVPAEWLDRCFFTESKRILNMVFTAQHKEYTVPPYPSTKDFPLPQFNDLTHLSESTGWKSKWYQDPATAPPVKGTVSKQWSILPTMGKSRDDLLDKLPKEWNNSAILR